MGHHLIGMIAKPEVLEAFSARFGLHKPLELNQGFFLLPLRDEDIDSFLPPQQTDHFDGFVYLSSQLSACLSEASKVGPLLYFETDYFGGAGKQAAAVYMRGTIAMQPTSAWRGPINDGLRMLAVAVSPGSKDEYENIGLAKHRHTEDLLSKLSPHPMAPSTPT